MRIRTHSAYAWLQKSMTEERLCGIGQFVISSKQWLIRLRAVDKLLVMGGLQYVSQVKDAKAFEDDLDEKAGGSARFGGTGT